MTSHALTLIGSAGSRCLEALHIERVCRHLSITGEPDWLAQGEACDLFIDSPLSATDIAARARADPFPVRNPG